ncbi:MAG: (deoxy)nucleoside triphosphate pyrophosphohydrolase [Eubacteriales bacterium]
MVDVVAIILYNYKGQVLIAKRKEEKKLGGYWEFPGGKVENGETDVEAVIRELKEEMDVEIIVEDYIGESIYHYKGRNTIRLHAYKGKIITGEIKLSDHSIYKWVSVNELKDFELAPADKPFINMIKKRAHRDTPLR